MTLKELPIGKTATVRTVGGEGALRQHFLDMGIIPGAEVTMVKYAPMGDPVEVRIHSYELTLRLADAGRIAIDEMRDAVKEKEQPDAKAIPHPGFGEGGKYHNKAEEHPLPEGELLSFALAGNQNCGKTTLLRTIARTLAERQRLVAVVDERGELFPPEGPLPPLERIGGVDKARAVQMALRTLAPHVILLDELGSLEETMALEQGFFSGVDFIASIHAPDAAQAQCRPQVQALLQRGMLRRLVILAGRETPGCIREVCAV